MNIKIACIPGDGIGPEIMNSTKQVIEKVCDLYGHTIEFIDLFVGSKSVDLGLEPFPNEEYEKCKNTNAILLGNMWMNLHPELPKEKRPSALLGLIRKRFDLSLNIRPNFIFPGLEDLSPLKESVIKNGFDIVLIRDLAGGELTGKRYRDTTCAWDMDMYTKEQIENLAICGFDTAMKRKKKLISLDKAIVLESSRFSRDITSEIAKKYPEVMLEFQHIDDAASQIIKYPEKYDVIITNGMFGDILADEIAGLSGIQKMLPSAELNTDGFGLYTPNNLHNTDTNVGLDHANPIGLIMASAMLFRYSLGLEKEATSIEYAVIETLKTNYRNVKTNVLTTEIIKNMKGR